MPTFKFTARKLPPLPKEGQLDYWDEALPGFGMRVSAGGTRAWIAMYRYNGVKRRMKIGLCPEKGLADARDAARAAFRKAEGGADPASEKKVQQARADTVEDLAKQYIELHAKPKKRSWFKDQYILFGSKKKGPGAVMPVIGRKRITDVTRADIRSILEPIVARGALTRANHTLEVVRKMFNWSIANRDTPASNPAALVPKPGDGSSRGRFLKAEELHTFWLVLDPDKLGVYGAASFKLFTLTAQREMEVMRMRWADLDLEKEMIWTVPADHAKNRLPHVVPLTPLGLQILRSLRKKAAKGDVYVFPSPKHPGKHLRRGFLEKRMVKIREASGITDFTPHDLRRTVTTYFGKLKVEQIIKKKILNHAKKKKSDVTDIYDQFEYLDEKRDALEKWEALLLEMVKPKGAGANVVEMARATV